MPFFHLKKKLSSSFGRMALLLAGLLILGQIITLLLFRLYVVGPSAQYLGSLLAVQVQALQTELAKGEANPFQAGLRHETALGIRFSTDPGPLAQKPQRYYLQALAKTLRNRLGDWTQVRIEHDPKPTLWVLATAQKPHYWLGLPLTQPETALPPMLLFWMLAVVVLSLLAAAGLAHYLNRPLRNLALATARIGKGELPQALTPCGPIEVQALTHAFNQMVTDVGQLETDRALLLAGISHDLRTPLTRLHLALEMIKADDPILLQGAKQDINDMEAIISQFIDYVRGSEQEKKEWIILDALVSETAKRYQAQHKNLCLSLKTKKLQIKTKPLALKRLLSNLLDNAFRHGQSGVAIQTKKKAKKIYLSVLDQGPGIPEAQLAQVLTPYTRLDSARSTPGSGLGLAIVQQIANSQGYGLYLTNRPGGGLEVTIEIELSDDKSRAMRTIAKNS